jgi:hypothetical protein
VTVAGPLVGSGAERHHGLGNGIGREHRGLHPRDGQRHRVPVTTSGATLVIVPRASLSQLKAGTTVFALGHAGPDGTLSAQAVAAITQPTTGGQLSVHASGRGCSPASLAAGLLPGA